uniref:Uncharacterized protein n=1 Tax=Branchiostoma floridae TaxID=7739 RepID=C3ZUF3_BRAFL|eukprot:XP_002587781.1 hypothetical protein BRAFLDRAFT_92225 [Branchiostoma floridae]
MPTLSHSLDPAHSILDDIPELQTMQELDDLPTLDEVKSAIGSLKSNKAACPDGVPGEILRCGGLQRNLDSLDTAYTRAGLGINKGKTEVMYHGQGHSVPNAVKVRSEKLLASLGPTFPGSQRFNCGKCGVQHMWLLSHVGTLLETPARYLSLIG